MRRDGAVAGRRPGNGPRSVSWLESSANLWNIAITRARAHLVVVGNRSFWRGRAGVVSALAEAEAGGRSGRPLLGAEDPDPTGDALCRLLEDRLSVSLKNDVTRDGYACDFVLGFPEHQVGVVLDRGPDGMDRPDRHLRLRLDRCDRLRGAGLAAVERIPAWRVHGDPDGVINIVSDALPPHTNAAPSHAAAAE